MQRVRDAGWRDPSAAAMATQRRGARDRRRLGPGAGGAASCLGAIAARPATIRAGVRSFPLPVTMGAITVSQLWHPRLDSDPAHRSLRGVVLETCREVGRG